ncbi:MAG: type IV pilin protein [Bacteriovoracia bacterium]
MFSANLRRHDGFTLIELMVVVAIVGLLSQLAHVSFEKSARRARQVEAKIGLASLYLSQQTVWMDSGSYSACLNLAGFSVVDSTARYYSIGFSLPAYLGSDDAARSWPPQASPPANTAYCGATVAPPGEGTFFYAANRNFTSGNASADLMLPAALLSELPVQTLRFRAVAAGRLRVGGSLDKWSIDQNKSVASLGDGV